jgi:hypothetical protein
MLIIILGLIVGMLTTTAIDCCFGQDWTWPWVFEEPRSGGFKMKEDQPFDRTKVLHFAGGMYVDAIAALLYDVSGVKKPFLWSYGTTTAIALAKEYEDGRREGFDTNDFIANRLGGLIGAGLYFGLKEWHKPTDNLELNFNTEGFYLSYSF